VHAHRRAYARGFFFFFSDKAVRRVHIATHICTFIDFFLRTAALESALAIGRNENNERNVEASRARNTPRDFEVYEDCIFLASETYPVLF